ncbi:DUF4145 domain-containing protein [Photobacterium halotolerans]|uniref:DUF4145 domain-containing protein n=1 Tax=Photobacterium halotolerans TaxID=265726 RepID=UPI001373391D|nr:DUF4145 domain-containing protein [Photobacterium halotolerans]NAX48818.1 DUF4145 domain-containing protein [Photobacterium halotolerans]
MEYVAPEIMLDAFHCPICSTYAHMNWRWLSYHRNSYAIPYMASSCSRCDEDTIWKVTDFDSQKTPKTAVILYPDHGESPQPEQDMPDAVKMDYMEAASILTKSPRAAAALLRLGLQRLCIHLGEKGKNIDEDIRELAKKNILPPAVIRVADTVRIAGNNAVHPGKMSDDDVDNIAGKMFFLLNFIVKKGISEPKEIEELYQMMPSGAREAAEQKDAKARENPNQQ